MVKPSREIRADTSVDAGLAAPTYDSAAPRRLIFDELIDLYRHRDLIRNLVRRNVTARYKRSVLGVMWTLLDPLFTMLIMTLVFSALFAQTIARFPLFLLAGVMVWNFISQASTQAIADLLYGGNLMRYVYMPRTVFAMAAVATGLVNLLFAMVPLIILVLISRAPVTFSSLFFLIAIPIVSIFTLGMGLFMSAFAVFFADVLNIHNISLQLLMWLSGIFYSLEQLPEGLRPIVGAVPTYHIVALFRHPIYAGSLPSNGTILYASVSALVVFLLGLWIFMSLSDAIAYRI